MPYDPKAIANFFLDLAESRGESLSPMKLQKLVYFAHGWNLALRDAPLIDEQVEAWTFGPVIPSIYREFRAFGNRPITARACRFEDALQPASPRLVYPSVDDYPEKADATKALLKRTWDVYGGYTAIQLSNMTHQPGTPWHTVFKQYNGRVPKRTDIPQDLIRTFFLKRARPMVQAR